MAAHVLNVNDDDLAAGISQALQSPIVFAGGFNGIRADVELDGIDLFEVLDLDYTAMLLDHPVYHIPVLRDPGPRLRVTVVDHNHLTFLEQRCDGVRPASFLPHGGCAWQPPYADIDRRRDIPLLFAGTLHDPETFRLRWRDLDPHEAALGDAMAEVLQSRWLVPLQEAVDACWGDVDWQHPEFDRWCEVTRLVDQFVRYERRGRLVRAALEAEPAMITTGAGEGWDDVVDAFGHDHRGPTGFDEILGYMSRSKNVLHVQPGFADGSHERPLCTLANGALPLCDRSNWFEDKLQPGREIRYYDPDNLVESIRHHLDTPPEVPPEKLAAKGHRRHGWANRISKLLRD